MARSAGRIRLLARRLHALPALGGAWRLGAAVEKPASRAFRGSTWSAPGFDDGTCASPRGRCAKKLSYDKELYRGRNRVERFFNKLKQFRRLATRYDKLAKTFLAAVCLVAAFLIIRNS